MWIGISLEMMPPSWAGRLLLVAAHQIDALHDRAVVFREDAQHFADLALVPAGA